MTHGVQTAEDAYDPEEREYYEDDLSTWEDEQVFQDLCLEREDELDDFGPFGIDGMGPDFE
jgi:hypothetical protein